METRQGVGPTWTHPLPGLHWVYTCSAPGQLIAFRQLLTITTVTITITLILIIVIIIITIIIIIFTKTHISNASYELDS